MTCKNCGTELPENETKCPKCGTPVEDIGISAAGVERAVPRGFSAKKNIIIIVIAAILLIGSGVTAIAVVNSHSASSGELNGLQLAERYLNEQNYEQAIIEFQKVLEIEPMNVDAYLGIAEAYLAMGDESKALEWLNKGYEETGDERIAVLIEELTKPAVSDVSAMESSVVSVPEISEPAESKPQESAPVTSEPVDPESSEPEASAAAPRNIVMVCGKEYDIETTYLEIDGNWGKEVTDEDVEQIGKLVNLTTLLLPRHNISDISPLANLTKLTELDLNNNQISDLSPLENLTNLTNLNLFANEIVDVSPLSELYNLTELNLSVNQIEDVSPLAGLSDLTELSLYDNEISDVSPLAVLSNLKILYYWQNNTSRSDVQGLKSQLPNCQVVT